MTRLLRAALGGLPEPDTDSAAAMARRAADVLRPPGALAALDDLAIHLAAWQGTTQPAVRHPAVLVFAGDHGVADAGVSNYPADITTAILAAIRAGRATVHAMARAPGQRSRRSTSAWAYPPATSASRPPCRRNASRTFPEWFGAR